VKIISIGEILWDVVEGKEHLGGAPFNFAAHAKRLGHDVCFISAVGKDERGQRILDRMREMGLSTRYVRSISGHATGTVTVHLDPTGQPHFVIHRPAAYDFTELSDAEADELLAPQPEWICFGTLFQMGERGREVSKKLIGRQSRARLFYDVNLRAGCYEPSLVKEMMSTATVVKLNRDEAVEVDRIFGHDHGSLGDFCRHYARQFRWEAVCVTEGGEGCTLFAGNELVHAAGYKVEVADAVGAGDAFAAAFIHGLSAGWPPAVVADFANRVGALIASRPGAVPAWTVEELTIFD
jgi:fructokinase